MTFLIFTGIILTFILYKRYFPVFGVQSVHLKDLDWDRIEVIDVRDYNESDKNPIEGALNIPIAYLKRNMEEIPKRELHLIVSSLIEKNIGVRRLRREGFTILGYTMMEHSHLYLKENPLEINTNL